ncbi:hypothetical protein C8Q75DRAFT_506458 [Abortiporus biennis]|nr:hypothetical protein C8Q75DRAFT_506458 [Abortiporus biennis]
MNASATIFETLCEVDTKFAKYADRECDGVSSEVKKWFKKLAKEEKAHDERIAAANLKIKQAGLSYEKKVKKDPRTAQDEHTRYINLLSSLGPEVTQDKYNHSLLVTNRHTATLCTLSGCLARIADGQWLRYCEGVRRFGPTIGQLGQWRSLCEGGWTGSIPQDLPSIDDSTTAKSPPSPVAEPNPETPPSKPNQDLALPTSPAPEYSSRGPTPTSDPHPPPTYFTRGRDTPQHSQNESMDRGQLPADRFNSTTSMVSLGAFPAPPTHFPLPPVARLDDPSSSSTPTTEIQSHRDQPPTTEDLRPVNIETKSIPPSTNISNATGSAPSRPVAVVNPTTTTSSSQFDLAVPETTKPPVVDSKDRQATNSDVSTRENYALYPPSNSSVGRDKLTDAGIRPREQLDDAEFGVRKSMDVQNATKQGGGQGTNTKTSPVESSDTGRSNGSVVAAIRGKYARTTGPSSPPPRDLPRLSQSVSHLANRFETSAHTPPVSPSRVEAKSPTEERRRASIDQTSRSSGSPVLERSGGITPSQPPPSLQLSSSGSSSAPKQPIQTDYALHRQRIDEEQEMDMAYRDHERQLRLREKEMEIREKELELERAKLMSYGRNQYLGGIVEDMGRYPQSQQQSYGASTSGRPSSQHINSSSPSIGSRAQYSYSSTQLAPPSPSKQPFPPSSGTMNTSRGVYITQLSSSPSSSPVMSRTSISDQRPPMPSTPSSPSYQPQTQQQTTTTTRPEKPKGWIRRLSMPVIGNSFSSSSNDSKKGLATIQQAAAHNTGGSNSSGGYRSSFVDEDGRIRMVGGGIQGGLVAGGRNRSTSNLGMGQ